MHRRKYAVRRTKHRRLLWACLLILAAAFVAAEIPPDAERKFSWSVFLPSPSSSAAPAASASGTLKVHFLDVGQADSEFIELPDGKCILIDAGTSESGGAIVSAIRSYGYSRIDYLIATHPHSDHIGGMETVVKAFEIGAVYMPQVSEALTPTFSFYRNLLTAIQAKGLTIHTAKAGVSLPTVGVRAEFVAPNSENYDDLNQFSAVLLLTFGSNRFLFMGDAGTASESEITADVKADVLKVGHHGSSDASGAWFLQRVQPKYAVIEVGKDNDYGHPAQSTLNRLKKIGAEIFRTDQLGTITFVSDGTDITADRTAAG